MTGLRADRHASLRPRAEPPRGFAAHVAAARKAVLPPAPAAVRIGAHLRLAHGLPVLRRVIHV
jgi:hypothetical protein